MNDKFELSEEQGRAKAIDFLSRAFAKYNPKIEKADQYARYDLRMTLNNGKVYIIECKDRKMNIDKYTSYILEIKKLEDVMQVKADKHIYLNTFKDGSILIYDLDKINFDKMYCYNSKMPISTDGNKTKITKGIYFLPVTFGKIF